MQAEPAPAAGPFSPAPPDSPAATPKGTTHGSPPLPPTSPSAQSPQCPPPPRRLWRSGLSELWEAGPGECLLRTNGARDVLSFVGGLGFLALALFCLWLGLSPLEPRRAACALPFALFLLFLASPLQLARRRWRGRPVAGILASRGLLRLYLISPTPARDADAHFDLPLSATRRILALDNFPPDGERRPSRWIPNCWVAVESEAGQMLRLGFAEERAPIEDLAARLEAARPSSPPCRALRLPPEAQPRDLTERLARVGLECSLLPMRRCLSTPHTMDFLRATWLAPDGTRVEYLKWPTEDPFVVVSGAGIGRVIEALEMSGRRRETEPRP
ncbi:MAG: hypothetical protein HYZ53_19270 [Planctomycetes bacterium]|nr:hypothetical protein [Planctomycetota bacterium]